MSKEGKHHYIPVFYLKQWAGADDRVCEFSKPYDRVKARRIHPDGTGYVHGLNRVPGLPPHEADFLESYFFKLTDDLAAKALRILLSGQKTLHFSQDVKSGWSRFITSLMMRNPESVEWSMQAAKRVYEQSRAELQADYNPELGKHINNMRWIVLKAHCPKFTLLTSDRPVLITNGLAYENSQLILSISPHHVFVATNNVAMERYIEDVFARGQMIPQVNERVALQARKYVYGFSDAQFSFVAGRLGKKYTATPFDEMLVPSPNQTDPSASSGS